MAFAQLTFRESLRDIEVCLRAQSSKLYHLGIRSAVARNTLANANAVRDWRIYADFAQSLIGIARPLYAQESFGVDLQETVYALDTTTIGTSENAVRSQIWIAVSAYVLVAIVKKRLQLSASLYEILQILSLTMFEKIPLDQLLAQTISEQIQPVSRNQLILFA